MRGIYDLHLILPYLSSLHLSEWFNPICQRQRYQFQDAYAKLDPLEANQKSLTIVLVCLAPRRLCKAISKFVRLAISDFQSQQKDDLLDYLLREHGLVLSGHLRAGKRRVHQSSLEPLFCPRVLDDKLLQRVTQLVQLAA